MRVADFDFDLPPEQIAQEPRPRGDARLLVVDRATGTWRESRVRDFPSCAGEGDVVVANDTRVFPARLEGRRDPSGGRAEIMLLGRDGDDWQALVHPGQKLKPGARVVVEDAARAPGIRIDAEILARRFHGRRALRLSASGTASVEEAIDRLGHVPLPPYIARPDTDADRERYQTVFAQARGSVAAPTAGLHFDNGMIADVRARGAVWETVTLHVGYGTFQPVRVETVEDHRVDVERFDIRPAVVEAVRTARVAGRRTIAVGTTTTRALESAAGPDGSIRPGPGATDLFIYPGYEFRVVGGLLTNFHLPRSSLLMLVSAFAGRDLTLAAYQYAVAEGFRFYSYGDAMYVA
jgi:S-adenosylmethionine:tRNA ribosyltransferase-isomerase